MVECVEGRSNVRVKHIKWVNKELFCVELGRGECVGRGRATLSAAYGTQLELLATKWTCICWTSPNSFYTPLRLWTSHVRNPRVLSTLTLFHEGSSSWGILILQMESDCLGCQRSLFSWSWSTTAIGGTDAACNSTQGRIRNRYCSQMLPRPLLLLMALGMVASLTSQDECEGMRFKHGVKPSQSWGTLPVELQKRWETLGTHSFPFISHWAQCGIACNEQFYILGEPQYYGSKFAHATDRNQSITPTCRIYVHDKIRFYLNWDQVR